MYRKNYRFIDVKKAINNSKNDWLEGPKSPITMNVGQQHNLDNSKPKTYGLANSFMIHSNHGLKKDIQWYLSVQ